MVRIRTERYTDRRNYANLARTIVYVHPDDCHKLLWSWEAEQEIVSSYTGDLRSAWSDLEAVLAAARHRDTLALKFIEHYEEFMAAHFRQPEFVEADFRGGMEYAGELERL